MKFTKTQMYIGIGLAIVAFLYMKKNKKTDGPQGSKAYGNKIAINGNSAKTWANISNNDRDIATAGLEIGKKGKINGTEVCTISELWKDEKGKYGALKCEGRDVYDLAEGSRLEF